VGIAGSLIARLSTLPGLVVRSVGSVRRFAEPARDPALVARLLAAVWILDGTLQLAGNRLRVSARLLSMPSGVAAWSGSFNVAYTDIFEVQDVVSERVAQAVAGPLGGRGP
jgi:TolB-like protein